MKKELNTIYTESPDLWDRVVSYIYFEYNWSLYKVIKYPVWFSYSYFSISVINKKSILWFEYEKSWIVHDEIQIWWNKGLYNGTSKLEPPKEVFVEVFEKYILT